MSATFAHTFATSGHFEADPRADGALRRVCLVDGKVVIDRHLDGMAMRLGIPCAAYLGVVLCATPEGFSIRLVHADPDLSVVLHESADDADIVAQWRFFAECTGLPKFLERDADCLESAETWLGGLCLGPAPVMRRRGAVALRRRPRFLTRRRMGERGLMKVIACDSVLSVPC